MDLSELLIDAAETEIGNYCIHTNPVSEGCDCSVQARQAVVAVLELLTDNALPMVYNDDPKVWFDGELRSLANKIKESNG